MTDNKAEIREALKPFAMMAEASGDLAPCPFCGGEADYERRGDHRQSCIVSCGNCGDLLWQEIYSLREKLKIAIVAVKNSCPEFDAQEFIHRLGTAPKDKSAPCMSCQRGRDCKPCGPPAWESYVSPDDMVAGYD